MNLVKSSVYTSISTAVSFLSGFVLIKIVSSQIGPAGIALVGQFQNTTALFALFGTLAISAGVVRAVASSNGDEERVRRILYNALMLVTAVSVLISLILLFLSKRLAVQSLHDEKYWVVFAVYAAFFTFMSFNTVITSFYNGLREIKILTVVSIVSSLVGLTFTVVLALKWRLTGVLIASNCTTLSLFLLNLIILKRLKVRVFTADLFRKYDKGILKGFLAFTLMNLVSGVVSPITQLLIRNRIILHFSAEKAGYWQSVTKISDYYLQFITTVLSIYYLPKLAELQTKQEIRQEIRNGYKLILPFVGILAFGIWLFRHYIILILFAPSFLDMKPYFTFQLLGDFFKMASWLLGYMMVAKSMTRLFIVTEIISSALFVLLSYLFIGLYGPIGATYAFCANVFLYLCFMLYRFRQFVF